MASSTVFQMVQQVLAESEAKLQKTAAAEVRGGTYETKDEVVAEETEKKASLRDFLTVADACDFLSNNLHKVAFVKGAEDIPMNPPLSSGVAPGGPQSAMLAVANTTPGTSLQPGQSGNATPQNLPPQVVTPNEKPNPADAANALQTNEEMAMAAQPENVLKQAGLNQKMMANVSKVKAIQTPAKGAELLKKAEAKTASDAVREKFAKALLGKFAEDALNPAQISAGTEPILQRAEGTNPAQMQGTPVGEGTPRETAPTDYQGAGRELISSNEAAINYTKGQAKGPQKRPLAELLDEPALSSAHDSVLNQSLDSTSQAGVKISAARELLKKVAASSPQAKALIDAKIKAAQEGFPPPGQEVGGEAGALSGSTFSDVSDEALAAAAEGVTTEELAKAQMLLAVQAAQSGAMSGGMPEGMPPEAMPEAGVPPTEGGGNEPPTQGQQTPA